MKTESKKFRRGVKKTSASTSKRQPLSKAVPCHSNCEKRRKGKLSRVPRSPAKKILSSVFDTDTNAVTIDDPANNPVDCADVKTDVLGSALETDTVHDPVAKSSKKSKEPKSKKTPRPAKRRNMFKNTPIVFLLSTTTTFSRSEATRLVGVYSSRRRLLDNALEAMRVLVEELALQGIPIPEKVLDNSEMTGDEKFGCLFEAECGDALLSVQFQKVPLDKDMRRRTRNRKTTKKDAPVKISPSTSESRMPTSPEAQSSQAWLLIRHKDNAVERLEQDVVVCSSKEIAIYNSRRILDNATNNHFTGAPGLRFTTVNDFTSSLDHDDAGLVYELFDRRGHRHAVGYRRFPLDRAVSEVEIVEPVVSWEVVPEVCPPSPDFCPRPEVVVVSPAHL